MYKILLQYIHAGVYLYVHNKYTQLHIHILCKQKRFILDAINQAIICNKIDTEVHSMANV